MVDSGYQYTKTTLDFYNIYKDMVDAAMLRTAQAEIAATWQRIGNRVQFEVQVKNLTGVTLSTANSATVHAIVYEDAHIKHTDRYGRDAVSVGISNLAPNASSVFQLETTQELTDVNWDKLHFVVLVDYRPNGPDGKYDLIQAAAALPKPDAFTAQPDQVTFLVDPADIVMPETSISIGGPASESWTASPSADWLTVIPSTGSISTQAVISVSKSKLTNGWQAGTVTFTNPGGDLSTQVTVNAYFAANIRRLFLPLAGK